MPKSLQEYAATNPVKGNCTLCKVLLTPELVKEMNEGIEAGIPSASIRNWLYKEHGIEVSLNQLGNHKRGLLDNPERHR